MGGALAGFGAGRDAQLQRRLHLAFMTSGLACLSASLMVLRIRRLAPR
jgi:hypothetical protein